MTDLPAVGIVGVGMSVPEHRVTNADLAKLVDTDDEWIRTRTGISERRVLSNGTNTSDLATAAAQAALEQSGVPLRDIDAVIVGTVSGDMSFPSTACLVQHNLGLPRAAAFDLGAACSGFIYGLVTATSLIRTNVAHNVLVIGADCLSKVIDWTDRSTCVLFGDGAGAAVVTRVPEGYGLLGSCLGSDGSGADLLKCCPLPLSEEDDRGYLQMQGREVFKFAVRIQGEACEVALNQAGLNSDEIDWLVPHQANIRIIEAAAERLKIPAERTVVNLDRYGNTSAASIPIALTEATADGRIKRGDRIMMVGFGAGLTWGAAVVRWY